jgi:hypothetical protein
VKIRKRRIWGAVGFFLIFSVLFVMVSYLLRLADTSTKSRFAGFYAEEDNTLDTVFIGSSAAYVFVVSPKMWNDSGMTSYVLGAPALPFNTVPALIAESEKSQHPDLYVVEIRTLISNDLYIKNNTKVSDEFLRNLTDALPYSMNRIRLINETVTNQDKTDWFFDLFHNHSNWKNLNLDTFSLMFYHKKSDVKSAYTVAAWQKQTEFDPAPYTAKKTPLEESSEQTLREVLSYCRQQNINVLFLSTPYVENPVSIAEENYVADVIESYGYPYLNCNYDYQEIGLDFSSDFYNNKHVNVFGSAKVTDYLLKYIMENYDMPADHTEDTAAEWNAAYAAWSEQAQDQAETVKAALAKENGS